MALLLHSPVTLAAARRRKPRLGRARLAASVSLASLLLGGAPVLAQQAGTLPGAQVLQGGRWTGARMPTVAQGNEGLVMTIRQQEKRALLDWARFDVAKNEEVHFEQDGADWIALNRIFDSKPSEIAGRITAKGQVWLQNTNGIIFREGAKVNAHTILATALPITEQQLNQGLLSGNGVIRGTTLDPLFGDQNRALVMKPVDGLDVTKLMQVAPATVGGAQVTPLDLLAAAAIRMAVLRANDKKDVAAYDDSYGLGAPAYYDQPNNRSVTLVDRGFANNGLIGVMDEVTAGIDVSQLGDYNYADFVSIGTFFNGGIATGGIPTELRDAVAAQIKAKFVDNYAALVTKGKQDYARYIANSRIVVERGATLTATSTDTASPGKIMLFGPNVSNAGQLTAHDGQVLIAAGEQIKVSAGQNFTNSVRGGLAVNVMAVAPIDAFGSMPGYPCCTVVVRDLWMASMMARQEDLGLVASNSGDILADRGAVTMVGADVDQLGRILVTNGVRQRTGNIVLQASHGFNISEYSPGGNYAAGTLRLGENSVTSIVPDVSDLTGLAADTFAKGRVLLAGKDIVLERNAQVVSRSGNVVIHANPYGTGDRGGTSPAADETNRENRGDDGSFTMRAGARIDVSGLRDVERSVSDNVFAIEIRANEVSGSPKQRDGILIGETVYVDRRTGSSIVDWTGALGSEQRTARELSTEGGKVQIRASKFAVIDDGAVIDVSGGSTKYTAGEVRTTRLKDVNGRFRDISTADANVRYTGLYEDVRVEQGYIEGADAGEVEVLSGSSRLFGKLQGDVVVGERQQLAAIGRVPKPAMPVGAINADRVTTPGLPKAGSATLSRGGPEYSPWSSTYSFITADQNGFTGTLWNETENNSNIWLPTTLQLDPTLIGSDWSAYEGEQPEFIQFVEDDFFNGMGSVSFGYGSSHQTQRVNDGVRIQLLPGGAFSMGAESGIQTIGDNVSVVVPSGLIGFSSGNGSTIGKNAFLSVAAPWVNDRDAPAGTPLGYFDGGSISLVGVQLSGPITIDASGGGWLKRLSPQTVNGPGDFVLVEGKGGEITLGANGMSLLDILDTADIHLTGLKSGGKLSLLAAGDIVIGPKGGSAEGAEYLDDDFMTDIGAGSLMLGADSITVAEGAHLLFQQRRLMFDGNALDVATGSDISKIAKLVLMPDHQRTGGSLMLTAGNALTVEKGAIVEVDALGSLTLSVGENAGNELIDIAGTLRARGGTVSVGGSQVRIRSTAVLDATGITQTVRTPGGVDGRSFWYEGRIVAGGSVSLTGDNLLVDAGAMIDVSGTSGMLSVLLPGRYGAVRANKTIGSDAGSIGIDATGGYVLASLRGEAGTQYNFGGKLSLSGGGQGDLLLPGDTDWNIGKVGVETLLQALQWSISPSPDAPVSLRELLQGMPWLEDQLGFTAAEMEDIQVTDIAEFTEFVRTAFSPLVQYSPDDIKGVLLLDPTLTALPDVPPALPGKFAVPEGYTPQDRLGFDRAMSFVMLMLGGPDSDTLARGSSAYIGAKPLADARAFDTLSLGGSIEAKGKIAIESQRVLEINGLLNGGADMTFRSRNISLNGVLPVGTVLAEPTASTLTISGETVELGRFNVGGFAKVTIEASGDMRGGSILQTTTPDDLIPGVQTNGALLLRAAQIYPTTDGMLHFVSTDSIRIERTGSRAEPLSAGGLMTFTAPVIEQAGTLRAPFGEIRLNAVGTTVVDPDTGESVYTPGRVTLLPGSVTSTSAGNRTILYGTTFDGQSWYRPLRDETSVELSTPPEKRVSLSGDIVQVQEGATIDVSGGGDVLGIEFVQGPLGQEDVLTGEGVYAIVPLYGSEVIAPIDPLYNSANPQDASYTGLGIGSAVYLAAFDGNPAGWYTLLPAKYALTPDSNSADSRYDGGYRITVAASGVPGLPDPMLLGDDSLAVLGYRGVLGTSIADQVQSTFRLERGTAVRQRSEYFETYGNSFFSSERFLEGLLRSGGTFNDDPRLPIDGGFLTLAANRSLELDGTIRAAGMTGITGARGGVVDITSDNIVIAAPGTDVSDLPGYLVLDPAKISNIAESLLIGGIRRQGASGIEILMGLENRLEGEDVRTPERSVGAENVVVRTSGANPLTGTEILFAANQTVRVETGAVVRAVGDGADGADMSIAPSMPAFKHPWDQSQNRPEEDRGGAFLRVSNLGDISVSRRNVVAEGGDLTIEGGATVVADDSVLLDATRNTVMGEGADVRAGAITAAAGIVSFGDVPAGSEGLVMSGGTLEGLGQAKRLTLKSYSTFDFYGDVALDLSGSAVLDGAAFVGRTAGNVSIKAGTLELRNTEGDKVSATGAGGRLAFAGDNVIVGEGEIDFAYDDATIDASQRLIFDGLGVNRFDGLLSLSAAEVTGSSGAGHEVIAVGTLSIAGKTPAQALPTFDTTGALLDFTGTTVDIAGNLRAGSGTIRATATEGDVHIGGGATLDVAGADVSFFEVQGFLPGGGIQLNAAAGDVLVDAGSMIDISGGKGGGDAGQLVLSAGRGIAVLGGTLKAVVAQGYRGGAFGLTTSTLADFGALNGLLNTSGFSRSRDFAILDGDVTLNGVTRVESLRIVTGTGDIHVAGDAVIGSDSAKGGSILLASGGSLTIADGASFDVSAKGADGRGGVIDLQAASGGSIDVGTARFDVSGKGQGLGGSVRLRAAQTDTDVGVARWGANVTGGQTRLEAFRVYDLADADGDASNGHLAEIDTALQTLVMNDANAFMTANSAGIRARLGQTGNAGFVIVPGIELRSDGDLDLVHNWNLAGQRFDGEGGVLTLRAGRNLLINANLSDGFISAVQTPDTVIPYGYDRSVGGPLPDGPVQDFTNDNSWSYNLVGGADFAQTNVLATRGDAVGNIEVGGLVRTGTGSIAVAAGGDLNYEHSPFIRYGAEYDGNTTITVPAGTPMLDGTVLKPTTYPSYMPNLTLVDPVVAAGTVFPAGVVLPQGTRMPDGSILDYTQRFDTPITFTAETAISGTVTVPQPAASTTINPSLPAGTVLRRGTKVPAGTIMPDGTTLAADTVLAADLMLQAETIFPGELVISGKTRLGSDLVWTIPGDASRQPGAPTVRGVHFTIAGLGNVEVLQPIGGSGELAIRLADGRQYDDASSFSANDYRSIEILNGAIYTVGVEDAPVANYDVKSHVGHVNPNMPGAIVNSSYMTRGGDVSVNVAGNIVGAGAIMEHQRWTIANGATPASAQYGYGYPGKDPNAPFKSEVSPFEPDDTGQTSLSLLADYFDQGIGALGGGDVTITSGGDVDNLVVAIPTWIRVSGGRAPGETKTVHYSGGGDLRMTVGQNLKGGLVHLGQGQATIDVAGSVIATDQQTNVIGNQKNARYLHLAIDDVKLQLQAGGDVDLRTIATTLGLFGRPAWLGYTANTSARITSLGGDINYRSTQGLESGNPDYLPSKTAFVATAGSINLGMPQTAGTAQANSMRMMFDMWPDTQIDMLAQKDVNFRTLGSYDGAGFTIGFADPEWLPRAINPGGYIAGLFGQMAMQDPLTGFWTFNQAGPGFGINGPNVHSGSSTYSRIYAAQGDLLGWNVDPNNQQAGAGLHAGTYTFGHETRLKAGGNIRMGEISFLTHDGSDVSTMEAGGAIYLPNAILYGPGRLWVQAGDEIYMGRTAGAGLRAREATSSVLTSRAINGGSISVLAGIDQAPEYDSFIDYYLDPEAVGEAPSWLREYYVAGDRGLSVSTDVVLKDGQTRVTVYAIELINYMRQLEGKDLIPTEVIDEKSGTRPITRGKLAELIDPAEYAAALEAFHALDPVKQRPLAIRILNAELKTAGREAVGVSPETDGRYDRNGDPRRGYDAIGRLFPGAQRKPGESLAEGEHAWTGSINMMVSQIRAESGGDVDLVAPGGAVQLASLSISNTDPGQAGIVTQRGGHVNVLTQGDYIVNQSRTMTADDGDIMIWSSYGNIDAGRGRKTSLSVPPVAFPTDQWGQTRIQLSGLPNGAGIATLDQVDGRQGGDVDLYAFNGIVNAGDAGIRASRDLFIGAIEIRGLDNITAGGLTNVDLTTDEGSVGPLNVENFAQSAEDDALAKAFEMSNEVEKLRTVRQTILTGSVVSFGTDDCGTDGKACAPRR